MINDRPVKDPNLQAGLDEVKAVMVRRGLAGTCMLVSANEAAFTFGMHAPWSALQPDPTLSDSGEQTTMWMEDFKLALRRAAMGENK